MTNELTTHNSTKLSAKEDEMRLSNSKDTEPNEATDIKDGTAMTTPYTLDNLLQDLQRKADAEGTNKFILTISTITDFSIRAATDDDEGDADSHELPAADADADETADAGADETADAGADEAADAGADEAAAIGTDQATGASTDQTSATGTDQTVATGTDQTAATGTDQTAASGTDQTAATGTDQTAGVITEMSAESGAGGSADTMQDSYKYVPVCKSQDKHLHECLKRCGFTGITPKQEDILQTMCKTREHKHFLQGVCKDLKMTNLPPLRQFEILKNLLERFDNGRADCTDKLSIKVHQPASTNHVPARKPSIKPYVSRIPKPKDIRELPDPLDPYEHAVPWEREFCCCEDAGNTFLDCITNAFDTLSQTPRNKLPPHCATMLFYGIPGTGKTAMAQHVARVSGRCFRTIQCSDLIYKGNGDTEKAIDYVFKQAEEGDFITIFDEVDSFLSDRNNKQLDWERKEVNAFLTALDQTRAPIICTTNLLDVMDEACLRRFSFKLKFTYLTPDQVVGMYRKIFAHLCSAPLTEAERAHLRGMRYLTPGDFSTVISKLGGLFVPHKGFRRTHAEILQALQEEMNVKKSARGNNCRPAGFIWNVKKGTT